MAEITDRDARDLALLQEIAPNGKPTPEQVINAARAKDHPWHSEIWAKSDKDAAIAYRLDIARGIISRVRFRMVHDGRMMFRPAYVRDPDASANRAGYIAVDTLPEQPQMATAVIDAELERVIGCLSRARALAAHCGLSDEFEQLFEQAAALKVKLRLAA
jgi:hypothetical protein